MPDSPSRSKFYAAVAALPRGHAPGRGPINAHAIQRDANLVLAKATSLLGYQQYLSQARSWKAQAKALPQGFEREVQAQAGSALADTQALASSVLRMTNQFKQSGELDRMLGDWIATIGQAGPIHTADLLADLENQASIRQSLQAEGISDDVWNSLIANLKNVDGSLSVQEGKLTAQMKVPGQDKPRDLAFAPSATGMPQTLSDLLRRGSFERLTGLFLQTGGAGKPHLLPGPPRDLELADVVLSGSILSVQAMAAHSRGLQDAGLAKYAGSSVTAVLEVVFLGALGIGLVLTEKYCGSPGSQGSAGCRAGLVLNILGMLGFAGLLLIGLGNLGSLLDFSVQGSGGGSANGVIEWSPEQGWLYTQDSFIHLTAE
jgi:hypothetical protein